MDAIKSVQHYLGCDWFKYKCCPAEVAEKTKVPEWAFDLKEPKLVIIFNYLNTICFLIVVDNIDSLRCWSDRLVCQSSPLDWFVSAEISEKINQKMQINLRSLYYLCMNNNPKEEEKTSCFYTIFTLLIFQQV